MLWGWGEEQPERERQKLQTRPGEAERPKQERQSKPGRPIKVSPRQRPVSLSSPGGNPGWGQCPPGGPQPGSPSSQRSRQPLSTAGQSWGGQGSVVWARSSLVPNQGSWKRLRVCNLGWGLTGGGGFAEGDNGEEPSPGLEQGAGAAFPLLGGLGRPVSTIGAPVGSSTSGPTRCESHLHQPQLRCVYDGGGRLKRGVDPPGGDESSKNEV